ncbi:MAG: adenylate/guanylate cyclase domain-containing protein [Polyangia bacterium]|jgi:class 3 adenylate cyclase|nr:adenylate/guanylate cyclase domain-containing protein [Polyangia bacterium]
MDLEAALAAASARIAALEDELAELQAGLRATITGVLVQERPTGASTVSNLEEMVLLVNPDRSLGYVNAPMARLLGIGERRQSLGQPLGNWDSGALGEGTLGALCTAALAADQILVVERRVDALPPDRLPVEPSGPRPQGELILRFVVTPMQGRVQITVQDVTRLRWLEATFSRFVSPRVIEQLLVSPTEELLSMQRREISMLYVDLRGFTHLSQTLPLPTLQAMMNEWFSAMQDAVEGADGTIGQFVGDQVVALFGAPLARPDHALAALCSAVEMQAAQEDLRRQWVERGWPAPGVGVGVATGEVAVGNMGTERHMYYTALGYWMNLGARLCAAAGEGEILTVPSTHARAKEAFQRAGSGRLPLPRLRFASQGVFRFKNVKEPTEVLSVTTVGPESTDGPEDETNLR